jgi:hypothetical protein
MTPAWFTTPENRPAQGELIAVTDLVADQPEFTWSESRFVVAIVTESQVEYWLAPVTPTNFHEE